MTAPRRWLGAVVFLGTLALATSAWAQAIPSPAAPGRIERELTPPPAPPPVSAPPPVPAAPAVPVPAPGALTFVLKDVVVDGATVYTAQQLRQAYQGFLGKPVSVDALAQLEQAITTQYRRDGYILARALIPSGQAIDPAAGIVHVQVYEGYIDKVRLDPLDYEVGSRGKLVRAILDKIAGGCRSGDRPVDGKPCPLHRDTLERYLLLANDLPGVKASAIIQPSPDVPGAADLFVTITEKPYDVTAQVNNRGSPFTGPFLGELSGSLNNLMDYYERTTVRGVVSLPFNELQLGNATEEIPLGSEGLRMVLGGTDSRSRPGLALRSQDVVTKSQSLSFALAYPLIRTRSENLLLRGEFNWRDDITDVGGAKLFDDHARILSAEASYDLADSWLGVNLIDVSVGQGLPILDATPQNSPFASHTGADGVFTKFNAELSRLQQILAEWNLLAAVSGQYSVHKLLVEEQFGYGGERFGRAYDPSEILGDRGIAGKLELQYTPAWGPGALGTGDALKALQFYTFYDIGRVWNPGVGEAVPSASAASTGAGVRYTVTDYVSGYLEVAKPLTRPVQSLVSEGESGKAPRIFFSVAARF